MFEPAPLAMSNLDAAGAGGVPQPAETRMANDGAFHTRAQFASHYDQWADLYWDRARTPARELGASDGPHLAGHGGAATAASASPGDGGAHVAVTATTPLPPRELGASDGVHLPGDGSAFPAPGATPPLPPRELGASDGVYLAGDGGAASSARAWLHAQVQAATEADERDVYQLTLQRQEQLHREQLLSLLLRDLEHKQRREDPWSEMARLWEQEQHKGVESGAGAAEPGVGAGTPGAVIGEVDVPTTSIPVAGTEGRRAADAGAYSEGLSAGDEDGVCSSSPEHVHTPKDWLKDWRWRGEGVRYLLVHHVEVGEEPYFYDRIAEVRIRTVPLGEPYEDLF